MKARNENLRIALKDYVSAALGFISEQARQLQGSSDNGDFDFYWTLARYSGVLHQLPQYESCLNELVRDKNVSKHLDQSIGSYSRGGRTPNAEGMMTRVLDLGKNKESYEFDPERFDREYLIFEETFYSEVLMLEAIAPLQGLSLNVPVVRLSSEVEISRLEEEEVKPYRATDASWDDRWCAVRVKYQLPKVIGDKDCDDRFRKMEEERAIEEQANSKIEDVVNALRLLGKHDVYHSGVIYQTPRYLSIHHRSKVNRMLGMGIATYGFGEQDAESLRSLWHRLELPLVRKELEVAVRRFGDSCVRHRNEDKLIDLMIAAEAVFLRGTKEGEKGFRLALRAGQFLSQDLPAKEVRDQMALAYYCRSVLVHGGKPSTDRKLKKLDLPEFIGKIGSHIHRAILKAIEVLASTGDVNLLDDKYWDRYLFDSTSISDPKS